MAAPLESRTISVYIDRPLSEVYRFLAAPENFPAWAAGLGTSIERADDHWVVETPQGKVRVRFTEPNSFGVLDHYVTPASGEVFYNPMRAVACGNGAEVLFTLFRQPGWSEERFAADAASVEQDLSTLKRLLEG